MANDKKKRPWPRFPLLPLVLVLLVILVLLVFWGSLTGKNKINGVLLLTENTGDISGYYKWERELDARGFKAIIKPEKSVLEANPEYFRSLADKGYEIATGYGQAPFWDMAYEEQYRIMKEYKEEVEAVIDRPVRIFSSQYFAYDENTLRAADALGIDYILARGTGLEAQIYQPKEYRAKLLLVSNLEFGDMGSGSLCDASLYQRGATAADFATLLENSLKGDIDDLILVSHVYIGGTREAWWQAYQTALDSDQVNWRDFDSWLAEARWEELPHKEIPYNTEVKYIEPVPAVEVNQLELVAELKENNSLEVFHNGSGQMCLDFLDFAADLNIPLEEHLTGETNFADILADYQSNFANSEGLSNNFAYFPIIFVNGHAFSGFNEAIGREIIQIINSK
jgi:hypothetical protein